MRDISKIRNIQIVASQILQLQPECRLRQVNSDLIDLYVELPIDRAAFLLHIIPERFFNADVVDELKSRIDHRKHTPEIDGFPIILAVVNENENSVSADFLLDWDYTECIFNANINLQKMDKSFFEAIRTRVRQECHQIRVLDIENIKFIKTIRLAHDRNNNNCNADLVYLRKMTPEYKINKQDPPGPPAQEDFPSDILDDTILEAVRTVYPEAVIINELLALSTDYRTLLRYKNYQKDYAEVRVLPDISQIPVELLQYINNIEAFRIRFDIFMQYRHPNTAFSNEGFEIRYPFNNWANILVSLTGATKNFESVSKLIDFK